MANLSAGPFNHMKFFRKSTIRGYAPLEVLVVASITGIMGALLPALGTAKARANRIKCTSNLKQVTGSLKAFANDNNDRYPWLLRERDLVANGGNKEWAFDVELLFANPAINSALGSPKILVSPSDPAAMPANEKMDFTSRNLKKIDRRALSYAVHLGGSEVRPGAILGITRNFDGDDAYSYKENEFKELNRPKPGHGRSLRVKNLQHVHFIGSDESSNSRMMAGLTAGQGQMGMCDGSAGMMSDDRFRRAVTRHSQARGGYYRGNIEDVTRPRQ